MGGAAAEDEMALLRLSKTCPTAHIHRTKVDRSGSLIFRGLYWEQKGAREYWNSVLLQSRLPPGKCFNLISSKNQRSISSRATTGPCAMND
jgi:hypothetical protein